MLPKQPPQQQPQQTYLEPGTWTSASPGPSQPLARSLSLTHYAFPSPTPPSALRSVQLSPPSPGPRRLPAAAEIKGGGIEEGKVFSDPCNCSGAAVVETERAPPGSASAALPLRHVWTLLGGSKTGRIYHRIMTDFGFMSSAAAGHSVLSKEKQFPVLNQAFCLSNFSD